MCDEIFCMVQETHVSVENIDTVNKTTLKITITTCILALPINNMNIGT